MKINHEVTKTRGVLTLPRDLGDVLVVGGDDDALDVAGSQRLVDAVLDERLPRVQLQVLTGNPLGPAARRHHSYHLQIFHVPTNTCADIIES